MKLRVYHPLPPLKLASPAAMDTNNATPRPKASRSFCFIFRSLPEGVASCLF